MLQEFIEYLKDQVGQPYVWGGQHTKLTASSYVDKIGRMETSNAHEANAIAFCRKAFLRGIKELYAYDCSGLGIYWICDLKKLYPRDVNADTMMSRCTIVSGKPKKGYWVFRVSGGEANHIGYMINDTEVIHAKGRSYGVVREKYSSLYWNRIGIPKIFAAEITGEEKKQEEEFVFTRNLKYGCVGEDVKELKKLLKEKGYTGLTLSNGNYYSSTKRVVKEFQREHGLDDDGIAGPKTIKALGGKWK